MKSFRLEEKTRNSKKKSSFINNQEKVHLSTLIRFKNSRCVLPLHTRKRKNSYVNRTISHDTNVKTQSSWYCDARNDSRWECHMYTLCTVMI